MSNAGQLNAYHSRKRPCYKQGLFYQLISNKIYMDNQKWTCTNPDTGEKEEVALEKWIWGVVYKDGTELHQFADGGVFNRIGTIDQSKVAMFTLYNPEGHGDGRIDILIPADKEVALIHKYRNVVFNAGSPEETRRRIYIFGYKVKGGLPHYNFVMPNGTIVQSYGEQQPKLALQTL